MTDKKYEQYDWVVASKLRWLDAERFKNHTEDAEKLMLAEVAQAFGELAARHLPTSDQLLIALQHIIDAKDALVRASIEKAEEAKEMTAPSPEIEHPKARYFLGRSLKGFEETALRHWIETHFAMYVTARRIARDHDDYSSEVYRSGEYFETVTGNSAGIITRDGRVPKDSAVWSAILTDLKSS